MNRTIRIKAVAVTIEAILRESPTTDLLWEALPIHGRANRWGEEIYFQIPLDAPLEDGAREEMTEGEIAYWPPGQAFCIFFGPTPASTGDAPRAASPVNPLGKVAGDAGVFRSVSDGTPITLERAG